MFKFANLNNYLLKNKKDELSLTSTMIEEICGFKLGESYYLSNTTGFNKTKPLGRAIHEAGYDILRKDFLNKSFVLKLKKKLTSNSSSNNGTNKKEVVLKHTNHATKTFTPSFESSIASGDTYTLFDYCYLYLINETEYLLNNDGYNYSHNQIKEIVDDYLFNPNVKEITFEAMLEEALQSIQTANRKIGVINYLERKDKLKEIFCSYNVSQLLSKSKEELFDRCKDILGNCVDNSKTTWLDLIDGILDMAVIMSKYDNPISFRNDMNQENFCNTGCSFLSYQCNYTNRYRSYINNEGYKIKGFGPAITPNYLKELGFLSYGKPDTHTMETFVRIGLCDHYHDYNGFHSNIKLQALKGSRFFKEITPYALDKVIWLACSGFYYRLQNKKYGRKYSLKSTFLSCLETSILENGIVCL